MPAKLLRVSRAFPERLGERCFAKTRGGGSLSGRCHLSLPQLLGNAVGQGNGGHQAQGGFRPELPDPARLAPADDQVVDHVADVLIVTVQLCDLLKSIGSTVDVCYAILRLRLEHRLQCVVKHLQRLANNISLGKGGIWRWCLTCHHVQVYHRHVGGSAGVWIIYNVTIQSASADCPGTAYCVLCCGVRFKGSVLETCCYDAMTLCYITDPPPLCQIPLHPTPVKVYMLSCFVKKGFSVIISSFSQRSSLKNIVMSGYVKHLLTNFK